MSDFTTPSSRPGKYFPIALLVLAIGASPARAEGPFFQDISSESGIAFTHFNGMSGELYFPEMTGQGGALFDYDSDGDLDLYLVEGAMLGPGKKLTDASMPYGGKGTPRDRLYRNDLEDGKVRFVDVTQASAIRATGYGMGVAVGDIDNDGHPDLYLTQYGANQLWRNRGDGTFEDITARAGVDAPGWSTSAAFFDYDRDGRLDLYVTDYVRFDVAKNPPCYATSSRRDYCGPSAFEATADRLFHNRGDGTFEDVSAASRIASQPGAGLGVISADLNGDGWPDLYVANDGEPNVLWINQKDGTFRDEALLAGVAVNRRGQAEASMGIAGGDFDGDGDYDLFLTHLDGESNTLYVNDGTALFEDRSIETGLAAPSMPFTSFGTGWLDVDNDGWLDLLVVSGAVKIQEALAKQGDPYPLGQTNQLFLSLAGRKFRDATGQAGDAFGDVEVSRGAAFGDLDNDGDTDAVVFNNAGPLQLLENTAGQARPWLGLRLLADGRDALGARVEIQRSNAAPLVRWVATDGSYCSANDPRILFGLGDHPKVESVRVTWPDGHREAWSGLANGAYHTLQKGNGRALASGSPKGDQPAGGKP